jgi:hypothetical protein
MTADPEDVLEPAALPEQGSDDDETLDDSAQGVSVTSDATADSTDETGEIDAIVQRTQVTAVPNEALRYRPTAGVAATGGAKLAPADSPDGAVVYVPQGDLAVRVPIKIGVTDGNMTEVDGLAPGSEVIIDVARDRSKAPSTGGSGRGQ